MSKDYKSKYGLNIQITAAQYIAEMMCERKAQKNGQALWPYFWKDKEWQKEFVHQCSLANKFLKQYPPLVIIQTLLSNRTVYSLRTQKLNKLFADCSTKTKNLTNTSISDIIIEIEPPRPKLPINNSLSKL
jgi:hypothetical protein